MSGTITLPLLEDLQGPWAQIQVECIGPAAAADAPIALRDVYPFTSVHDVKRLLWHQLGGDPRWAPERVFLGVRSAAGIRPVEFHWPASVTGGSVDLPFPQPLPTDPAAGLVDEVGNRRAVSATLLGSLLIEAALSPERAAAADSSSTIPRLTAISLAALQPETPEALTPQIFHGVYQLYFPWLTAASQILDATNATPTPDDAAAYAAVAPYLEDRTGRIQLVERAIAKRLRGSQATMQTMVRLRWMLPPPSSKPTSLEATFYGLTASQTIPFLRFFPVGRTGGAPLIKLALRPDGAPVLDNERVLAHHLSIPAPATKSSVILARVPLAVPSAPAAAFTLYMFEDGTSDITLEVPNRGMTYLASVAADAERTLRTVVQEIGFPAGTEPALRDIHATYRWTHPDPRRSAPLTVGELQRRVAALTPFLDTIPQIAMDATTASTALASFKWRAVSNYESESAQFAFITQLVLAAEGESAEGGVEGAAALLQHVAALQERFGLSHDAAIATLERWAERRAEAVAPALGPAAGSLAVPKHNTGTYITVGGTHPEYTIEIQGADSLDEVARILSVAAVLVGISASELTLAPPVAAVQEVAAAVEIADAAVEEEAGGAEAAGDVELAEMDPALAALVGDIDFGLDEFLEGDGEAEAAAEAPALSVAEVAVPEPAAAPAPAAPNLEAAAADVEDECRGVRWQPGEPPLAIPADYYMVRLKRADTVLFGYTVKSGGRSKGYSKTCQRQDERQPNILTLAEYARVRRCYRGRVRFVDLPPRSPADLPSFPDFNPRKKKSYPDEFFMTDPTTGLPMWSVYGYESKTTPGEFRYLMCAELWCERDNLPLIRSEFAGTVGRGFTKPANTCPFCGGAAIQMLESPRPGESVIVRLPKESTGKVHGFIGTIQVSNKHPDGYPLPCCDTTPRLLKKYLEAQMTGTLVYGRDLAVLDDEGVGAATTVAAAPEVEEVAEPPAELEIAPTVDEVNIDYGKLLGSMPTQYILGADKSLDAGKLGLLPAAVDAFMGQESARSLERRGIRPTFAEGATLFVRVGVDNRRRTPGLNLFAALAPFLGGHSAPQTRRSQFLDIPAAQKTALIRAFESANYGTLLMEFAARSTLSDREIEASLATFAGENGYELGDQRAHVARLYKAWVAFLTYLMDDKTPKQMRHLEHLLAQPGVVSPRGLLFVVLRPSKETGAVEVVCPSFGIPTASIFGDVPVAFLLHNPADESWEPLVLYNGSREAVRLFGERSADLDLVPRPLRQSLARWIRDWRSASLGCGRPAPPPHVWTPDRDTTGLPRLSALRSRERAIQALVRDRSNRLAGVMLSGLAAATTPIFVPCLDDGALMASTRRIYEATAIPAAPLETYLTAYRTLAAEYPALAPVAALARLKESSQIIAFRTRVGTAVPVAASEASTAGDLPIQQVDELPWERDALILRAPDAPATRATALEETTASPEQQLAEAYQLLRLSLSRWLIRDAAGPTLRSDIAAMLTSSLPLYERRKRMDIRLEPLIRQWVAAEKTDKRATLALLRTDCLAIPSEGDCTGGCRWSGGRCLIHAPHRSEGTDPVRILTARLSDELLRYPTQRRELMEGAVSAIRTPRGIVRIGDELYMATLPKEGAAAIVARLGFTGEVAMSFPEEMLRFEGMEDEVAATAAARTAIPEPTEVSASAPAAALPADWRERGLMIATPSAALEPHEARLLAFADATKVDIANWETRIKNKRSQLDLPGPADRPFQFSTQDMFVIARLFGINIVFARAGADGRIQIDRWIAPSLPSKQPMYTIFWGPQQLTVNKGAGVYRFIARDLPLSFLEALDQTKPLTEAEARGYTAEEVEEDATQLPPPAEAPTLEGNGGQMPPPATAPIG